MNLNEIKQDKIFLALLIIVILLGIFVRFNDFSGIGYWTDDQAHIPAGLMWFYPHDYFPGLNYGNPPLGDIFIGLGCKLSGEDFSGVSKVHPFFYPDRPSLLPNLSKEKVDMYCHLPMYIFGLIFFILIIIFALTFFESYPALFLISFFAFYNQLLTFSRWIKPDVVLWVFLILGIFFLLKTYYEENFKKELIFSLLSFAFFALALATKFTALIFFLFAIFILLVKHKLEVLTLSKKLNLNILNKIEIPQHEKRLFKILIPSLIIFLIILIIPFNFNPKNIYETYQIYQQMNQNLGAASINPLNIIEFFKETMIYLNAIDVLIFLFSLYLFIKIIFIKDKTKLENFLIYFTTASLLTALFFSVIKAPSRAFPFFWSFFAIMALAFSNRDYSILKKFNNKRTIFLIFIIIYISLSFILAFNNSPYFQVKNPVLCHLYFGCEKNLGGYDYKPTAEYLKSILKEGETFTGLTGTFFFYLHQDQSPQEYYFEQSFLKQVGRHPTLLEKVKYFHPNNQTIRYLLVYSYEKYEDQNILDIKNNYQPIHKIVLNGETSMLIYDLKNLKKNV